ncbi:MAG: purine-nucleoside phosphorylase [Myxococcales bacterium]
MTIHLEAKPGDYAPVVLLPGDPLRAQFIAEKFLTDAVRVNNVRGAQGFTGTFQGKRISVQATGMGMPSHGIYVQELLQGYGAQVLIRVGTCGALQKKVSVRDLVLAMSASYDSAMIGKAFGGATYAPTADFGLLQKAHEAAVRRGLPVWTGPILTSDTFYAEPENWWASWNKHGVLACEMETAALYTLAARFGARALTVLTVSDHVLTGEHTSSEERQTAFGKMIELALEVGAGAV